MDISICKHEKFLPDFLDLGKFWLHFLRYIGTVLWSTRSKNLVKPPRHKLWDGNRLSKLQLKFHILLWHQILKLKKIYSSVGSQQNGVGTLSERRSQEMFTGWVLVLDWMYCSLQDGSTIYRGHNHNINITGQLKRASLICVPGNLSLPQFSYF